MSVTIIPEPEHLQETARRLLELADDPTDVATDTSHGSTAFVVSDELAARAGYDLEDDEDNEPASDDDADDGAADEPADTEPADTELADNPTDETDTGADDALIGDYDIPEPPRSGKGSGDEVWRAFLTDAGIAIPDDVTKRDDLIELWDNTKSQN